MIGFHLPIGIYKCNELLYNNNNLTIVCDVQLLMVYFRQQLANLNNLNYAALSTLHVLILNGAYNGQKLIKLVNTNIPAKINKTIPKVPDITFVKYNTAIKMAISTLIILSVDPIFFFIIRF